MPNGYYFVPPHRVAEMADEIRRNDNYNTTLRAFIERCFRDSGRDWYKATKLINDVSRLIDPGQSDEVRVYAARRLLIWRIGKIFSEGRWAILAPTLDAQASLHQQLLADEVEQRNLAALFTLLHEDAACSRSPLRTFLLPSAGRWQGR